VRNVLHDYQVQLQWRPAKRQYLHRCKVQLVTNMKKKSQHTYHQLFLQELVRLAADDGLEFPSPPSDN